MNIRYLGKESNVKNSPSLYATDQDSYIVQGWRHADLSTLNRLTIPDDETIVEVPPALFNHLAGDSFSGTITVLCAPIMSVTQDGNYIVQGKRVTDAAVLAKMNIPAHETCVEVKTSDLLALFGS